MKCEWEYIKAHPKLSTPIIAEVLGRTTNLIMETKRCMGYDRLQGDELETGELVDWLNCYNDLWILGRTN